LQCADEEARSTCAGCWQGKGAVAKAVFAVANRSALKRMIERKGSFFVEAARIKHSCGLALDVRLTPAEPAISSHVMLTLGRRGGWHEKTIERRAIPGGAALTGTLTRNANRGTARGNTNVSTAWKAGNGRHFSESC